MSIRKTNKQAEIRATMAAVSSAKPYFTPRTLKHVILIVCNTLYLSSASPLRISLDSELRSRTFTRSNILSRTVLRNQGGGCKSMFVPPPPRAKKCICIQIFILKMSTICQKITILPLSHPFVEFFFRGAEI